MATSSSRNIDVLRMRSKLSALFSTRASATDELPLPEVAAPSLDGICLRAPSVSDDEVRARVLARLRRAADRAPRRQGEPVQAGDELVIDLLCYSSGVPVPFGARFDHRCVLEPSPLLPGLDEQLSGVAVGTGTQAVVRLSRDYPASPIRGAALYVLVDVKAASRLDPAFSAAAVERAERAVEEELKDFVCAELVEALFDHLSARVDVELPDSLVDTEIIRRFGVHAMEGLLRLGLDQDELAIAAQVEVDDPLTRAFAERRLRATLALRALAKKERVSLPPALLASVLEAAGAAGSISEEMLGRVPGSVATRPWARNALGAVPLLERLLAQVEVATS